jgi:hypothetical protein
MRFAKSCARSRARIEGVRGSTFTVRFRFGAAVLASLCMVLSQHADAGAAPVRSVNEYGSLTLKSSAGASILEQGHGWGSFDCGVSIRLTVSGTLVTASYTAYPHGGSLRGQARAYIHSASRAQASYSGTIWLHGGSGAYAGASGSASFDGTINRKTYAMTLHISGRVRL